jgi:hypothetical protein
MLFSHYDKDTKSLNVEQVAQDTLLKAIENFQSELFSEKVRLDEYKSVYEEAYEKVIEAKILADTIFLSSLESDKETINQYSDLLISKRRQLIRRNKWGEVDLSEWHELLREFMREKLDGYLWSEIHEKLPDPIKDHLKESGLLDYGLAHVISIIEKHKPQATETPILTGIDYEKFLVERLQDALPNALINKTPTSGDQGADIILCIKNKKIAIQAKYYTGSVGNSAVQEVYAASQFYEADECMVVCNSTYTTSARILASKTGVILCHTDDFLPVINELIGID